MVPTPHGLAMDLKHDGPFNSWLGQVIEQGMVSESQRVDQILGVFPGRLLWSLRATLECIFGREDESGVGSDEDSQEDAVIFCLRLVFLGREASRLATQNEIHNWVENLWRMTNLELMRREGLIREWQAKTLDREEDIVVEGDDEPECLMRWMVKEQKKRTGSPKWSDADEKAFWDAMDGAKRQIMEDMGLDMPRVLRIDEWH
jgi:hypothetical protein